MGLTMAKKEGLAYKGIFWVKDIEKIYISFVCVKEEVNNINLMGNVKYIEGYNKDTQKKNIDCNSFRRLSRGKLVGSVRAGV